MRWLLLFLCGCATVPSAKGPMERLEYPYRPGHRAERLIVMVHGRGDDAYVFENSGFMEALAQWAMPIDVVTVNAHAGYFKADNFAERLHDDVIFPKRQEGYREIFILGVSRGALGALLFARRYSGEPDGLILFAPYLGHQKFAPKIEAAGGLLEWHPTPPVDDLTKTWQWLAGYAEDTGRPPLELLYGTSDPSVPAMRVLRVVLQDHRVHYGPGGHDWKTWRRLWGELLERDPFGWKPELDRMLP